MEFHPIDETPEVPASYNLDIPESSSNGSGNTLETRPLTKKEHLTQKRGEIPHRETTIKHNRSLHERHKDTVTVHDKKILAEVRPPVGAGILGKVSPLTNSWESFTRPIELSDRSQEDTGEMKVTDKLQDKEDSLKPLLNYQPQIPETRDISEPTIHYDVLLKSLGLKQKKKVHQFLIIILFVLEQYCIE